jgi:hypothetical protein
MKAERRKRQPREQVIVYLDAKERELLDRMSEVTGLARTELFRRGLRKLAEDTLAGPQAGSSLMHLIEGASDDAYAPDLSERHDEFLYGGGYESTKAKTRARPR